FHARDMAILRSKIEKFPVILSSATPAIETFHNALINKFQSFKLEEKFGATNLIEYIDLRQEKLENGQILSTKLSLEIAKNIANKKQILLFLNRRGYSPVTICKACGTKYDCKNCDFHLVHHKNKNLLVCHHCGYQEKPSNKCKFCGEEDSLISVGFGVEKLHEEVKLKFPDANIAMVNSDEIKSFDDAEEIISKISCGTIDIIIGTQMISKGYDFPNLNLVGIVDVDSLLYSSDLRALEKSYQILTQVMGRAGRSKDSGKILIQTYNPQNLLFQIINSDNKNAFYDFEINNRQALNLPPFSQMIKIEISALKENIAKDYAKNFISHFPIHDKIEIFGPAPAPIQKLKNRHHFLIHIKANRKVNLQKLINDVRLQIKLDPKIKIRFNINP
ncbi:MAG: primosomal protein N', partial [Alphaproteobacteria bacterium]